MEESGGQWFGFLRESLTQICGRFVDMAIIAWYHSSGFAKIWRSSFSTHRKFLCVCLNFLILTLFAFGFWFWFWFWFLFGFCAWFFSNMILCDLGLILDSCGFGFMMWFVVFDGDFVQWWWCEWVCDGVAVKEDGKWQWQTKREKGFSSGGVSEFVVWCCHNDNGGVVF